MSKSAGVRWWGDMQKEHFEEIRSFWDGWYGMRMAKKACDTCKVLWEEEKQSESEWGGGREWRGGAAAASDLL